MIVEATLPLLLEHGEMVTTRQIAEAAGIAEGTIFRVFADKDEVIAAVVDAAVDPTPLEEALAAIDADAAARGARVTEAVAILQRRTIDIWRLMSSVGPRFHDRPRPDARQPGARRALRGPPRRDHRRAGRRRPLAARRSRCRPATR